MWVKFEKDYYLTALKIKSRAAGTRQIPTSKSIFHMETPTAIKVSAAITDKEPKPAAKWLRNVSMHTFALRLFLFVFIITGACCLKPAVIGCVRLYQHYAPEGMRRRCLLKPTCSEYAILAVKKYGAIIGIYKTCVRLFVKCKGEIYHIDEP